MNSPSIKKLKKKQFLGLGYGINSYFYVLEYFIILFAIMTAINLLIMWIYSQFDGMKTLSGVSTTAALSIGNLGFSSTICRPVNFGVDNNILSCKYGNV